MTTQTHTINRNVSHGSPVTTEPESIELSLKTPGKTLRELSRRVTGVSKSTSETPFQEDDLRNDVPSPATAHTVVERWNKPRKNIPRCGFAFLSFGIAGLNDGAVGALIPYLETYYDISYTVVSLIFLTPFIGYMIAAFTNAYIHTKFGQRGIAFIAPICHMITFLVLCLHPPWPVLIVAITVCGYGNGLLDAGFSAWVGGMDKSNIIQGILHSSFSVGALFAPLIATSMIVKAGLPWYSYYYFMLGISGLEWVGLTFAFWDRTGEVYRNEHPRDAQSPDSRTREAVKSKITWLLVIYYFVYMGIEIGLGGWIVTFMLRVRSASPYASGVSVTGYWAGMALGRAGLGFVTERFGERLCITIYLLISIALQLIFWLVPKFVVSAIAIALLGLFIGPMFPGGVTMAAKLLPKHIHVSALGFAMAFGGIGGTVFPFAIGAIAASKGVAVLQPIILALIVVLTGIWLSFPRIRKRE